MTVLSVKETIELSEETGKGNPFEVLFNEDLAENKMDSILKLIESFTESTDIGKKQILNSITEAQFVDLARAAQNSTLCAMVTNGEFGLLESHMDGSLKGYTHTVVLSIIGILFNEGVL